MAGLRMNLKKDKYANLTKEISELEPENEPLHYHSQCYRQYTAVKRKSDASDPAIPNKEARIVTRQRSPMPKSDEHGLLKGDCIFCGRSRKKLKGKEEPRQNLQTEAAVESINERVKYCSNERIKALVASGIPLIAKSAEYHRSCYALFDKETSNKSKLNVPSSYHHHKYAFDSICTYIEDHIILHEQPTLLSSLLTYYISEFVGNGGNEKEITSYGPQNLQRKIMDKYHDRLKISMFDKRSGNLIYTANISEDLAHTVYQNNGNLVHNDTIRSIALQLRAQILMLPQTKIPKPTTIEALKECSPDIPPQLDLFFRCLISGLKHDTKQCKDSINRKVVSMASDAIYNVSRGNIKPWKHTVLGLGLASLTGSKITMQILNRHGHCIDYNTTKGLETEIAYSIECEERDTPDGIELRPNLSTASAWDNNDSYVETLDGKSTLHITVGHTYQNILDPANSLNDNTSPEAIRYQPGRSRRTYQGKEREIPSFRKPLKKALFNSTAESAALPGQSTEAETIDRHDNTNEHLMQHFMKPIDLYWLHLSREKDVALHAGFISNLVTDRLPLQRICYMDPISSSPTNNDVVRETMVRTINVARETGQEYAVVTYDLAVASKAYSIQSVEAPTFDKLLVMLGNFHIELAFFGAVGTYLSECGIEFILSESGVLAEGSMMGFLKGKLYNRCIRIHQLLANILERKIYECFMETLPTEELETFKDLMCNVPLNSREVESYLENSIIVNHLNLYERFLQMMLEGSHGPTAQFWAIYVYLINRLHREMQRVIKMNDVAGYITVLPAILDVFFALNRPNYARWGSLFLKKLENAPPPIRRILDDGAFSIRRTQKNYSRSAIDLSLEQTFNRDAASQVKGIVSFRNSENAMRRWSITMAQRAMAVTELRSLAGLDHSETVAMQCRNSRIAKDNKHMNLLSEKMEDFCNPFSNDVSSALINVATGRAATKETESYLITTLTRGHDARENFQREWERDASHFHKPLKRIRIENFAAENMKLRPKVRAAEMKALTSNSLRDMFIRMVIVASQMTAFDLRNILSYPVTEYPLSLAHSDGSRVKSDKSTLLNKLESLQSISILTQQMLPKSFACIFDGGLILHSVLSQARVGASFGSIARQMLVTICSGKGVEVHLCLDKYVAKSIKGSERKLRGSLDLPYVITGPEQTIRQCGQKLLSNGEFKNAFSKFIVKEWRKQHYYTILEGKVLFVSYGGECYQYIPNQGDESISVEEPSYLRGNHEEADTLIAFHAAQITGDIVVRASDTDVLIILIGFLGEQCPEERSSRKIFMDCGVGNHRRLIDICKIVSSLEGLKPGLSKAMPAYHAFTGCDYTSAFYR